MHLCFQFSSVAQSCLILCDPMNRSTPGLPVHHQLPEFTQTLPVDFCFNTLYINFWLLCSFMYIRSFPPPPLSHTHTFLSPFDLSFVLPTFLKDLNGFCCPFPYIKEHWWLSVLVSLFQTWWTFQKPAGLSVRSVGSTSPTKWHSTRRARILCMPRESGVMTGNRVAMVGRLSRFSGKRLKLQRRLC